jgi:hypothetical protein
MQWLFLESYCYQNIILLIGIFCEKKVVTICYSSSPRITVNIR